ncbi:monooxygenase [Acuticoccus sediminis]|uniref:4-hydroxybenzoate brominase (decarboxylating) n=1 Tax=Acuticoccus sediminis TaxID=2184697 RepID=A0A8B2NNM3_9HYPH|nr:NAD(P)-binding domain-containing protein [Acuticoccus sediminis]RAI00211.1 monooxygenase [Acuticoccus sediminis]
MAETAVSRGETAGADVCVIGAGVSGLTAIKALAEAGVAVEGVERGSDIGGMWRYENDSGTSSAYRSLHIDSSRQSLAWPDFPLAESLPDYPSHGQMLAHFERYADRFALRDRIRFGTTVVAVTPAGEGFDVTTEPTAGGPRTTTHYRTVIVANGHLSDPRMPDFPGTFDGTVTHSHHYRTAGPYAGKRVLVVGIGNSAVDIAVDVAKSAEATLLSTRRSAWIMPKYVGGIPTDRVLGALIRRFRLPVPVARSVFARLARLTYGRQERFGVPLPEHPVWREHATLSQDLLPYLGHGWIRMKPNVSRLEGGEIAFVDGTREKVDAIVYATGYRTTFPFLDHAVFAVGEGVPPALYRRIVSTSHPNLMFAGLLQPIGPTIPLVEVQARWMAALLSGRLSLPAPAEMTAEVERHRQSVAKSYLNAARYTLEVDAREYAGALNADLARVASAQPAGAASRPAAQPIEKTAT